MVDTGVITPYSTVMPYVEELPRWIPEEHQERIVSYFKYDDMYWSMPNAFKIATIDSDSGPIYVPKPKTIVDTTSHYLLKGLELTVDDSEKDLKNALDQFFARERFYSLFHVAKHSGVSRGDFILHLVADPNKPPNTRVSIKSVHPAAYFPVYDEWDPDKLLAVHLAEQIERIVEGRPVVYIRKLTYEYKVVDGQRRVQRTELVLEEKDWFDPKKAKMVSALLKPQLLHPEITTIPVYHFPNVEWQGEDFGRSEIAGFERLVTAINQTITDEEVALALEGIGVYATDAPPPRDPETGEEMAWSVGPGKVLQTPLGSYFKRVEGVGSVTPMLDHVRYLQETLHEASGTSDVARGLVDVQVAQSGIALAIRFLPMLAKIEERDKSGQEKLRQLFYDWTKWTKVFEGQDFVGREILPRIGDKLPENRVERLNELNNMLDRKVISRAFYRTEMQRLGYKFPDGIEKDILREEEAIQRLKLELQQEFGQGAPDTEDDQPTQSNLGGDPRTTALARDPKANNPTGRNESGNTEA